VFCEWKRHFMSCETNATRNGATNFRGTQHSHPGPGCYLKFLVDMISLPSHRTHRILPPDITFYKTWSHRNEGEWLSTEHTASLISTASPRAATLETPMIRVQVILDYDLYIAVFTADCFAPSMVIDRPRDGETIYLKTSAWVLQMKLRQGPRNTSGYTPVGKVTPQPSDTSER
jgi:hypothetical protein